MRALQLVEIGAPLVERVVDVTPVDPDDVVVEVRAAGICHSDVHYRRGPRSVDAVPMTLGHEVAGIIEDVGASVDRSRVGERVCLHYQTACMRCERCAAGYDQFCEAGRMIGKGRDGGYAEYVTVPARNAIRLPDEVSFEHGAVMMCSSATSLHALDKAGLSPGETVAVFGAGGLGMSAIQLAAAMGASSVLAIDVDATKLALAARLGAVPITGGDGVAERLLSATRGAGVHVALDLVGLSSTMRACVETLGIGGRAVSVGISDEPMELVPFTELALKEAVLTGVSDHHIDDIVRLLGMAVRGQLQLDEVVTNRVSLDADQVNAVMDDLERYRSPVRTVILP